MDNWFSTQVDRDFQTGMYGYGIRLYNLDLHYYLITGVSYDEDRCDYKPWAHTSLAALAAELGLHSSGSVNVMYIR